MKNTTPMPGRKPGVFSISALAELPVLQFTAEYLQPIDNEERYEEMKGVVYALMTQGPDEPNQMSNILINIFGMLIEQYEDEHYPISEPSPVDILKHLMEQHDLTQAQLPEIGSQGVVSEVLRGIRQLNTRQIQALSNRFNISPAVFFARQPMATAV
jgi:HTH-type transcriptional regulator/antitoxin HigA